MPSRINQRRALARLAASNAARGVASRVLQRFWRRMRLEGRTYARMVARVRSVSGCLDTRMASSTMEDAMHFIKSEPFAQRMRALLFRLGKVMCNAYAVPVRVLPATLVVAYGIHYHGRELLAFWETETALRTEADRLVADCLRPILQGRMTGPAEAARALHRTLGPYMRAFEDWRVRDAERLLERMHASLCAVEELEAQAHKELWVDRASFMLPALARGKRIIVEKMRNLSLNSLRRVLTLEVAPSPDSPPSSFFFRTSTHTLPAHTVPPAMQSAMLHYQLLFDPAYRFGTSTDLAAAALCGSPQLRLCVLQGNFTCSPPRSSIIATTVLVGFEETMARLYPDLCEQQALEALRWEQPTAVAAYLNGALDRLRLMARRLRESEELEVMPKLCASSDDHALVRVAVYLETRQRELSAVYTNKALEMRSRIMPPPPSTNIVRTAMMSRLDRMPHTVAWIAEAAALDDAVLERRTHGFRRMIRAKMVGLITMPRLATDDDPALWPEIMILDRFRLEALRDEFFYGSCAAAMLPRTSDWADHFVPPGMDSPKPLELLAYWYRWQPENAASWVDLAEAERLKREWSTQAVVAPILRERATCMLLSNDETHDPIAPFGARIRQLTNHLADVHWRTLAPLYGPLLARALQLR